MRTHLASRAVTRPGRKGASSVACLAFVALIAVAFWAGAVWIVQILMQVMAGAA